MVLAALGMLPALALARLSGPPANALAVAGTGLTPFYVLGFELGPWQDYLARQLTPDYLSDPAAEPLHISWLDQRSVTILPLFAQKYLGKPSTFVKFEVDWQRSDDLGMTSFDPGFISGKAGLERQLISSSLQHRFGENQLLGVAAVFATQSYGLSGLGLQRYERDIPAELRQSQYDPYRESAYGTGIQLALRNELSKGIALDAGFQSRINMDQFANYRGVYAQPADFDIPARAKLGLAFRAGTRSWLNVAVERVLYSEVGAFASRNLPGRFLSLLGDTTSPSFSWNDLTVYSVGWNWDNSKGTSLYVDFSSRTQPSPSSRILSQAIDADLANNAMKIGFSQQLSMGSRLHVNAAYAPSEYAFGGNVLGVTSDHLNQDFELEALWTLDF